MQSARQWILIVILAISLFGARPTGPVSASIAQSPALQSAGLQFTGPTACPPTGCAGGQRLSLRFTFAPKGYDAGTNPNVKVCVYAPDRWINKIDPLLNSTLVSAKGVLSASDYTEPAPPLTCDTDPSKPNGSTAIIERVAQLPANQSSDALDFSFRLAPSASGNGLVITRLLVLKSGQWVPNGEDALSSILPAAPAASFTTGYVANTASSCGTFAPCYVNSGDDGPGGAGTGLKDAVDAITASTAQVESRVFVIGNYLIKSNTVLVNKAVTITSSGAGIITYNDISQCDQPMLSLEDGVKLTNLNINDGVCTTPSRTLIQVNQTSPDKKDPTLPVLIESNTLLWGKSAIFITGANLNPVTIRFNQIIGNANTPIVYQNSTANSGSLNVTANNIYGNVGNIDCAEGGAGISPIRKANHNFWGGGVPDAGVTHCTITAGKQLGMAIAPRPNLPGVSARLQTVLQAPLVDSGGQVTYSQTGTIPFQMYIIDHGYLTLGGPPFTYALGLNSPSPCGNYWDFFLEDGELNKVNGSLNLSFKYNKTQACQSAINSYSYCDQTGTPANYPLYWYDPTGSATKGWITTGSNPDKLSNVNGQVTTCSIGTSEISVTIDTTGRPNLDDLSYLPFMVGVPILKSFLPLASNNTINVTWTTNNEPDVSGFYVLRGLDAANLSPLSDLIVNKGSAKTGSYYSFLDSNRTNGTPYYYRLQIMRTDGTAIFSNIFSISANIPTPTSPPTITPTPTTYYYPSSTARPTTIFTQIPTRIPTRTATLRRFGSATPTFLQLPVNLLTGTPFFSGSQTFLPGTPGFTENGTPGTEVAMLTTETITVTESATPSQTPTPPDGSASNGSGKSSGSWLSLIFGILAGLAATGGVGAAWYYLRLRQ